MSKLDDGKVYKVGKMFNKVGDCYTLWQQLENGVVYYNLYKESENPVSINCAYSDLGYLLKVKGF